jgi:hypothetical protein
MQQEKYIFHLYVFSTCFGRDITHHQELQNCTHSNMVMVPREIRRDVVEEIKWRLGRQYYARVGDVKRVERSLVSRCDRNSVRSSQVYRAVVVMRPSSGFLRRVVCFISSDVSDKRNSLFLVD